MDEKSERHVYSRDLPWVCISRGRKYRSEREGTREGGQAPLSRLEPYRYTGGVVYDDSPTLGGRGVYGTRRMEYFIQGVL